MNDIKAQMNALMQERDSALQMLVDAENEAMKAKGELRLSYINNPELAIRKQLEEMKCDYSDAISLMDNKCKNTLEELYSTRRHNEKLSEEIEKLKTQLSARDSALKDSVTQLEKVKKERDDLHSALEHCHHRLNEAIKAEFQAREKVSEAIDMAQRALQKEHEIAEEKSKLEKAVEDLIEEAGAKMGKEVESVTNKMNLKIDSLKDRLQAEVQEKNRLITEFKAIKAHCSIKVKQLTEENENLTEKLKAAEERYNKERIEFDRERETLRKQVVTLQAAVEYIPEVLRQQQPSCKKCAELINFATYYKDLADKYKKISQDLSDNYEKALTEERKSWRDEFQKLIKNISMPEEN